MTDRQTQCIYKFGDFHIETHERLLKRNGEVIHLPPKVIDLLLVLVESGGRVLSKNELMQRVWTDSFVEETNLTHNISLLRRVFGEKQSGKKFIETIPRRGYRFVAEVTHPPNGDIELITHERTITQVISEEELEVNDAPDMNEKAIAAPRNQFKTNSIFTVLIISILAIAAILGVGGYAWRDREKKSSVLPFQQTSIKQLTTKGSVYFAALSPDGKFFAYTLLGSDGRGSLWLRHVDGSREIELRPPAEVVYRSVFFSPDNARLYFVESDKIAPGTLYRMPILGGSPEKIKENMSGFIAFAPDGKEFAYVRRNGDNSVLAVSDVEGKNEREVASRPGKFGFMATTLAWSPDGQMLTAAAVSVKSEETVEFFIVNLLDGTIKPLTNQLWKSIGSIVWLKNGKGFMMTAADKGSLWFGSQLWHVSYPDGVATRITSDLSIYGFVLSPSADSNTLLTVTDQYYSNIWVAPAEDLSRAKQITFDSVGRASGWNGLAWLSGSRIVYTTMPDKNVSLWTMDADGNNQKELLPGGYADRLPTVPADGRFIIFESDRGGSGLDIWRLDSDGNNLRQLTFGAKTSQPHVSPDGRWVTYMGRNNERWGLWRVSTEGGEPVFLNDKATISPRFSPDSKLIAVGYNDNGKGKLAVLSAESGEVIKLFDIPRLANLSASMKWTPDGRAISYRDWADGIWTQSLAGGEPERLKGLPNEKLYGYDWSPDGKFFAFTRGMENRDVILIRNLVNE